MNDAMSKLVGQIYEATLDQSIWPKVLEDLSTLTGARGAHILLFDRDNQVALGEIGKLPAECQRWPGESGQRDKWIFCLRAARIAADQEST